LVYVLVYKKSMSLFHAFKGISKHLQTNEIKTHACNASIYRPPLFVHNRFGDFMKSGSHANALPKYLIVYYPLIVQTY